jgi:hypothetical protein
MRVQHSAPHTPGALVCAVACLSALAASCGNQEIKVRANGSLVWDTPKLLPNALYLEPQLGLAQHQHPSSILTAHVDAPDVRHELLFFRVNPQASFDTLLTDSHDAPQIPDGNAVGYLHAGGAASYEAGAGLVLFNGIVPQSIRGVYTRRHGECELEVKWGSLLNAVMAEIDDGSAEADCNKVFCPNYDQSYSERVGMSYLRKGGNTGGFGVFVKGKVEFDSPFIDDMSFYGKVAYDLKKDGKGMPVFSVAGGPLADAWDCSDSPFTDCPHGGVKDGVKKVMHEAPQRLNDIVGQCLKAPLGAACNQPADCTALTEVKLLALGASQAAVQRGFTEQRQQQLSQQLLDANNWACAPVSQECAALSGAQATSAKQCQLNLRPSDVVVMPDSFSLVWYVDNQDVTGQFTGPPTAAEALYLGLVTLAGVNPDAAAQLANLCTPLKPTRARPFVRVVDNSDH